MKRLLLLLCFGLLTSLLWGQSSINGKITATSSTCGDNDASQTTACVVLPLNNSAGTVLLDLSGTFSATVQFEVSATGGGTWRAKTCYPTNSTTGVSSATAAGGWTCPAMGASTHFRVRSSAYSSGTVVVQINQSNASAQAPGAGGGGGSGTVTSFSSGDLSPLFITSVADPSSTPAQTFTLSNAGAYTALGNNTAGSAAPAYVKIDLAHMVTGTLPVANGGTGTTTPALVAGTNVTITGTWPNQTINSSGGGGSGCVPAGSVNQILTDSGSGTCTSNSGLTWDGSVLAIGVGGSVAGGYEFSQGTTNTPSANSILIQAPTSVGTAYTRTLAGAAATGIPHYSNSANVVTETISAIVGSDMTNNTVTATQLAAQYSKGSCTEIWGGSGTSFAMTSGDDAISNNSCYNDSGVTRTITAVKCRSDNAANTTTVNPTFGSAGTGTTILSGALTCGNSYAYSSSGTVSNASWTTGSGIDPGMATVGNATSIALIVEYTF